MSTPWLIRLGVVALLVALSPCPLLMSAETCSRDAQLTSAADVYEQVPRYVTGQGWIGKRTAQLSKNTRVYVCREQRVQFGFATKVWYQIGYREDEANWKYGWILQDYIQLTHSMVPDRGMKRGSSLVAVATAEPLPPKHDLPDMPLLPQATPTETPPVDSTATSLGDLIILYQPLFIAMLLGMTAKALSDWLDMPVKNKRAVYELLRSAVSAFLVSPIVFLSCVIAGQFSTTAQTWLVLCLLAFQNGFFWQAVLKRDGRPLPPSSTQGRGAGNMQ